MGLVLVRFICDQSMHNIPNRQESDLIPETSRFPVQCKHCFPDYARIPEALGEQFPITTNNDPFVVAAVQFKDSGLLSSIFQLDRLSTPMRQPAVKSVEILSSLHFMSKLGSSHQTSKIAR